MRKATLAFVAGLLTGAAALVIPAWGQQKAPPAAAPATAPATEKKPLVQIAILLDTSNSMDGLIDQARTELWRIVNEIAKVKVEGQAPDVQVALYHYGTPTLGKETGYIRQLVPLSNDLDKVSEELFKLSTNGGDEYCGWVIKDAVEDLKWSDDQNTFKAIFIAGNEPFSQGPVDFHASCKEAASKGIVVNTIFCGPDSSIDSSTWKDGAKLAEGSYSFIEQNQRVARAAAPQDKELSDLSAKLNETYVPYGRAGLMGAQNQQAQDTNAVRAGGSIGNASAVAADRAITKGNQSYQNATWDLVDAVNQKQVVLADVKTEDLPQAMRGMSAQQRADFIAQKTKERADLQAQIRQLADDRDKYLASVAPPAGVRGAGGAGGRGGAGGGGFGGAVIGGANRGR